MKLQNNRKGRTTNNVVAAVLIGLIALGPILSAADTSIMTLFSYVVNSWTQSNGLYIATDEIRARDIDGLEIADDSGTVGFTVQDGGGVLINTLTLTNDLPVTQGGTGSSDAGSARTALGVAIGSDVQAFDATLSDLAGLSATPTDGYIVVGDGSNYVLEDNATARTSLGLGTISTMASNNVLITGGTGTFSTITGTTGNLTTANITTLELTNFLEVTEGGTGANSAGGARTALGLAIGSDVQAWDDDLDDIAALTPTDSNFLVGDGTDWVKENASTARTSLGLDTMATQDAGSIAVTGGTIDGVAITNSTFTGSINETFVYKTAAYQASAGEIVGFDTSSAASTVRLTLPTNPTAGQMVTFLGIGGTASTTNATIDFSEGGDTINGAADNLLIDANRLRIECAALSATAWSCSVSG
jgi:hypothetical protein